MILRLSSSSLARVFRTSRPRFWLYLAGPVLVALAHAATTVADLTTLPALALVAYFLVPANVYLYGVNDVFDADADAVNPRKADRERRYRGDTTVVLLAATSGVLGVVLAAVVPTAAPWLFGFLVLGWAYSAPPLRLKTVPPLDSVSNGLYVLPGAAAWAALTGSSPPLVALLGGWLWTMGMHTFSAVPDVRPDRRAGVETTATVLGPTRALAYVGACWTLAALVFAVLDYRAGLLLAVYPLLVVGIATSRVPVSRAYWWFPAVNTAVGTLFAVAGLWGLTGA